LDSIDGHPVSLMVLHFAKNLRRCALGLSEECPPNWPHSTKVMSAGLSSKSLASIAGLTMDEVMPHAYGRA